MIPPATEWLNCVLIASPAARDAFPGRLPAGAADALARYAEHTPTRGKSIWFDRDDRICFSAAQFRGGPCGKDYNFLADPEDFLGCIWGERFVAGSLGMNPVLREQPRHADGDIIRSDVPALANVAGKRVLIVLGGPSTRRVRWEAFEHDLSWTCNKFYLNPRVARPKHDLIALAPDVPLIGNRELLRCLDRQDATVAFEIDRGGPVGSWREINRLCTERPSQAFAFFHLRYQSALGLGSRLLILALLLGAREVGVVGLDGMSEAGPLHAFERYKSNPNWVSRFGLGLQRRQYVIFWEYVAQLCERFPSRIYNLGEGDERNVSRGITKHVFPLPPALARSIVLD